MPNIYSSTNDGDVRVLTTSGWNSARGADTGTANSAFSSDFNFTAIAIARIARGAVRHIISRAFFEFDTSGISGQPDSVTLKLYGAGVANSGSFIAVRSTHSATLADGDYDAIYNSSTELGLTDGSGAGTLASVSGLLYSTGDGSGGTGEISSSGWDTSGYNDITLNAQALTDMASEDTFKVCLMNYTYDYLDIEFTGTGFGVLIGTYYADYTGTSRDPYIDYSVASAVTYNATFFGANF